MAGIREGLAAGILLVATGAAAFSMAHWKTPAQRPQLVVVALDRSASLHGDACSDLPRILSKVLGQGSNTDIVVLASSGLGIERLGAIRHLSSGRLLEGSANEEILLKKQTAKLTTKCQKLSSTGASPVVQLIERGMAYLPGHTCATERNCQLIVRTDGHESVDTQVRRALARDQLPKRHKIRNKEVTVTLCGLADVRSLKGPSFSKTRRVWRALFLKPDRVRFNATCPLFVDEAQR